MTGKTRCTLLLHSRDKLKTWTVYKLPSRTGEFEKTRRPQSGMRGPPAVDPDGRLQIFRRRRSGRLPAAAGKESRRLPALPETDQIRRQLYLRLLNTPAAAIRRLQKTAGYILSTAGMYLITDAKATGKRPVRQSPKITRL